MWICSTLGYFSIVKSDREEDRFLVRARTPLDLEILKRETGLTNEVVVLPDTDYAARLIVSGEELGAIFGTLERTIDYRNFKDRIKDTLEQRDKGESYGKVWNVMFQYQDRNRR